MRSGRRTGTLHRAGATWRHRNATVLRGHTHRTVAQMYFPADEALLKQDKVLMHDLWGKAAPMPSNVFGQLQPGGSKVEAGAAHYRYDIVLFDGR